jgi:hypothetical protein
MRQRHEHSLRPMIALAALAGVFTAISAYADAPAQAPSPTAPPPIMTPHIPGSVQPPKPEAAPPVVIKPPPTVNPGTVPQKP